jgi:subtilisin family serine protease
MRLLARGLSAAALLLVPLAVMPSGSASASTPATPTPAAPAPLFRSDQAVPDQYIVTLQKSVTPTAVLKSLGVAPMFTYGSALRGFAAVLSAPQLAAVRKTPGVTAVEENAAATAYDLDGSGGSGGSGHAGPQSRATAASWGLDRIDQRKLPLDRQFTTAGQGQGATAYIMDSGIDFGHSEFGGRAVPGFDAVGDGRNGQDCQGHGTHVAGTVGGATYGVAPKAKLVSVRVLGCDGKGSWAGIIAGFDWIAKNAQQPAVMNASLGGSYSPAVNDAANAVAAAGVLPVIAAGNSTVDACGISPASADQALTVGATDRTDQETDFSNYGSCLSVFAPGKDIVSAKLGGGSVALDGTSMASPHAAGVALLYKAKNPSASAADVANWLKGQATSGVLTVSHNSPDRLLFTGGM